MLRNNVPHNNVPRNNVPRNNVPRNNVPRNNAPARNSMNVLPDEIVDHMVPYMNAVSAERLRKTSRRYRQIVDPKKAGINDVQIALRCYRWFMMNHTRNPEAHENPFGPDPYISAALQNEVVRLYNKHMLKRNEQSTK